MGLPSSPTALFVSSPRASSHSGAQTLTLSFSLPSPQTCEYELPVSQEGKRTSIQMIASTCLLISAKFFDRKLPPLSELEKVHQKMNSPAEFAELELRILEKLQWKLHMPLRPPGLRRSSNFLRREKC